MPFVFTNRNGGMRWGEQSIVDKNDNLSQITATGGTVTTSGSRYIHTFTSNGTFTLSSAATIDILLVGGGGAGGTGSISGSWEGSGGGGGGGLAYGTKLIPAGTYTVTVGEGGVTASTSANFIITAIGGNSSFTNGSIINETAKGGSYGAAGCAVTTGGGGGGGSSYALPSGTSGITVSDTILTQAPTTLFNSQNIATGTVANNAGLPAIYQNTIGNGNVGTLTLTKGSNGQNGLVIVTFSKI